MSTPCGRREEEGKDMRDGNVEEKKNPKGVERRVKT